MNDGWTKLSAKSIGNMDSRKQCEEILLCDCAALIKEKHNLILLLENQKISW